VELALVLLAAMLVEASLAALSRAALVAGLHLLFLALLAGRALLETLGLKFQ
jgi:hypothetical protein